ncbi:MAG TPA: response regulator [Chloroflexota bacterium]|nr:response regulator [Chloroflexota bacterium]
MTRILVVDDNASVRTTARALLEAAGYEVVEAESGAAALRTLSSEAVEAVVTDIFMPDTDGIELIHALHRQSPDLPVVAMSGGGYDDGKDVLAVARLFGAVQIVQKPLTQRKLVGAIRRALAPPRDGS